jgi:predicted PurR-regulated permease PerM
MNSGESGLIKPWQKKLLVTAGLCVAGALIAATLFGLAWLVLNFLNTFADVLLPLAVAAVIATLLRPSVNWAGKHLRIGRTGAIFLLYGGVIIITGIVLYFIIPIAIRQTQEFLSDLPALFENLLAFISQQFPVLASFIEERISGKPLPTLLKELQEQLELALGDLGMNLLKSLGDISEQAGLILGKIAAYAIIPVYAFFLLSKPPNTWETVETQLSFLPKDRRDDVLFLAREFVDILTAFFRGKLVVATLLAIFLAVGFSLIGLRFAIVVGIIVGFLNIIPYLGTILGIIIVLPIAYLQPEGGWQLLLLAGLIFAASQALEDYVLMPRVMKGKTGMSPMLIIFSIFFWGTAISGILGLLLAIPLTACFLVAWRLIRERYLNPLAEENS